jgi:hypothetical protein
LAKDAIAVNPCKWVVEGIIDLSGLKITVQLRI